ncbi:MAG: competence type IV pilus major pilin ComGC [Eubacteriales bacterium]
MRTKEILKSKKGFTLTELMIVVVILGILVLIAVPIYNNVTDKAETNACLANIRTIESAIIQYRAVNDGTDVDKIDTLAAEGYLKETPKCPSGGEYEIVMTDGVECVECSIHSKKDGENDEKSSPN